MLMTSIQKEHFISLNCSAEQIKRYPKLIENVCDFLSNDSDTAKNWPPVLEIALAKMTGFKGAIAVQSFADTVKLSLSLTGIKPEMEVVVPESAPNPVLNAIIKHGAIPKFARCRENLSIDTENLEDLLTSRTSALFNFNYCGVPSNSTLLQKFAKSYDLILIEGANFLPLPGINFSQTIGSADALVLSLTPLNVVHGLKGFGVLLVNDEKAIFDTTLSIKVNRNTKYARDVIPSFERLDGANAAVACSLLEHAQRTTKRRIRNANYYQKYLQETQLLWGFEKDQLEFNSADYFILNTMQPHSLAQHLKRHKINSSIWGQVLSQSGLANSGQFRHDNFSQTNTQFESKALAIPCHDYLGREQLDLVIEHLTDLRQHNLY